LLTTTDFEEFRRSASNLPDVIYIGQKVVSCFGGGAEKLKISKQKDGRYEIEYTGINRETEIVTDSLFEKHLSDFFMASRSLFSQNKNGRIVGQFSTTRIYRYIRTGNTVIEIPDQYGWEGYDNFKKQIGVDTDYNRR
jgi:hypothetical protein